MLLEIPEYLSTVATSIKNQCERALPMDLPYLFHQRRNGTCQRAVQRLREEEQYPSSCIMDVSICMPLRCQMSFCILPFRRRVLTIVRTKVTVYVIQPFPDRLQFHIAAKQLAGQRHRVHTLR